MHVFKSMDLPESALTPPARRSKLTDDSDNGITKATEYVDRTVEVDRINDQRMIIML